MRLAPVAPWSVLVPLEDRALVDGADDFQRLAVKVLAERQHLPSLMPVSVKTRAISA